MRLRNLYQISLICSLALVFSCGPPKMPSRKAAENKIMERMDEKGEYIRMSVGPENRFLITRANMFTSMSVEDFRALAREELITFTSEQVRSMGMMYTIELTDNGMKYADMLEVRAGDEKSYRIKLGEQQFLRIAGIRLDSAQQATVEYVWTRTAVTPFGGLWPLYKDPSSGIVAPYYNGDFIEYRDSITMSLYDDGWR